MAAEIGEKLNTPSGQQQQVNWKNCGWFTGSSVCVCVCVSIVQSDVEFLIGSNCAAENIRWLDAVCMLHAVFEGTTTSNGILFSQQKRTKNETKQNIIPKHRKHCARILRTNIHSTTQTNKICKFASPYYYMVFALSWIESIGHWIAAYFEKKNGRPI